MKRIVIFKNPNELKFDPDQPRKSFKMEDVRLMAETYNVHGIINDPEIDEDDNIITGELRVRGAIYLKLPEIECILITGLSKIEKRERQVIENTHRCELTSEERENAISELWESGKYKEKKDFAILLGYTVSNLNNILKAKSTRDLHDPIHSKCISTKTLIDISPLPKSHQAKVLKKINEEKLAPSKVRDFVKTIKELPSDVKEEMLKLNPIITIEEAKEIVKIPDYVKKETQKPESEVIIETARDISEFSNPEQRKKIIDGLKRYKGYEKDLIKSKKKEAWRNNRIASVRSSLESKPLEEYRTAAPIYSYPRVESVELERLKKEHKEVEPVKTFKVNKFITLKLEHNKTIIYVKNKIFQQCKFLLLNIPKVDVELYDEIKDIDEAKKLLDSSLELKPIYRFNITPEEEFQGHCSNLQVWVENHYNPGLLHSNLSFPLLLRLTIVGDETAKLVFKEAIATRYIEGNGNSRTFLQNRGYMNYFNYDEAMFIIGTVLEKDRKINIRINLIEPIK